MRSFPRKPGSAAELVSALITNGLRVPVQKFRRAAIPLVLAHAVRPCAQAQRSFYGQFRYNSEYKITMTSKTTTLDSVPAPLNTKTILAKEGFHCSLLTLAPGDETPRREANQVEEHVLFVADGSATIRIGDVNTILAKDQAILIRPGQEYVIAAHPGGWAKILKTDVPPRQIVTPQIITLDR